MLDIDMSISDAAIVLNKPMRIIDLIKNTDPDPSIVKWYEDQLDTNATICLQDLLDNPQACYKHRVKDRLYIIKDIKFKYDIGLKLSKDICDWLFDKYFELREVPINPYSSRQRLTTPHTWFLKENIDNVHIYDMGPELEEYSQETYSQLAGKPGYSQLAWM